MLGCALGAAQTTPVAGDVSTNTTEHLRLAELAREAGARVLVFPELSLTGYEMTLMRDLAFTLDDKRFNPLATSAHKLGMTLLVGAPLRIDGNLHITSVVLTATGERKVYTKQYLGAFPTSASVDGVVPPAETTAFSAGNLNPQLEISGQSAAIAVCADANRPAHAAKAASKGATLYLVSSFVIPSEFEEATTNLAAHAKNHGMTVVFANYGAASGGLQSAGQSSIWLGDGRLAGRLGNSGSGVVVALERAGKWSVEAYPA